MHQSRPPALWFGGAIALFLSSTDSFALGGVGLTIAVEVWRGRFGHSFASYFSPEWQKLAKMKGRLFVRRLHSILKAAFVLQTSSSHRLISLTPNMNTKIMVIMGLLLAGSASAATIVGEFAISGYMTAYDAYGNVYDPDSSIPGTYQDMRDTYGVFFPTYGVLSSNSNGDYEVPYPPAGEVLEFSHPYEITTMGPLDFRRFEVIFVFPESIVESRFYITTFHYQFGYDYISFYGDGYATMTGKEKTKGTWSIHGGGFDAEYLYAIPAGAAVAVNGVAVHEQMPTLTAFTIALIFFICFQQVTRWRCNVQSLHGRKH